MVSDDEIHQLYGRHAVISRKGSYTLVHLDRPSSALVRKRLAEFDPRQFLEDDCPLCQILIASGGGVVVFDDTHFEDEDVLIE